MVCSVVTSSCLIFGRDYYNILLTNRLLGCLIHNLTMLIVVVTSVDSISSDGPAPAWLSAEFEERELESEMELVNKNDSEWVESEMEQVPIALYLVLY